MQFMIDFNQIKIIVEGEINRAGKDIWVANSNVILIKGKKNLIIDTGFVGDDKTIISELKKEGLTPEDIAYVILTHNHLDHTFNTYLFKNANVLLEEHFFNLQKGTVWRANSEDIAKIPEYMKVLTMPGHVKDQYALLFMTDKGNLIVAGDAIPSKNYIDEKKQPSEAWDIEKFNESRNKILNLADWVIPGHGPIIKVKK